MPEALQKKPADLALRALSTRRDESDSSYPFEFAMVNARIGTGGKLLV